MNAMLKIHTVAITLAVVSTVVQAQDYNKPLTMEALNHTTNTSVLSRSLGGLTLSSRNDVSTMFSNPAALLTLNGIQFSTGSIVELKKNDQSQRWYKLDWQPLFEVFMEGKTGDLRDPIATPRPDTTFQDSLPRNSRNPDWSRKKDQFVPSQAFAAMPFALSGMKFAVGIGVVEYANADYYYENRTSLSRNLDYITLPVPSRPDSSIPVDLFRDARAREGSMYGYGGAVAAEITKEFSVGLSCLYISGTMKDQETRDGYGTIGFYYADFSFTENPYTANRYATSDVSGLELTFSGIYRAQNLMFGISIKPPTTITRDFTSTGESTKGTVVTGLPAEKGSDHISLPLRGSMGIQIHLRENVFLGAEYEYKPYRSAEFTDKNGAVTNPWLDCSNLHFGLELWPVDFVSVRLGYQTRSEVFEQQGNPLHGDPISYVVYSAGIGINLLSHLQLNLGYEYMNMHYEDNWRVNTNVNRDLRNTFFGSISYTLK